MNSIRFPYSGGNRLCMYYVFLRVSLGEGYPCMPCCECTISYCSLVCLIAGCKGFAFVEFFSVSDATTWMEENRVSGRLCARSHRLKQLVEVLSAPLSSLFVCAGFLQVAGGGSELGVLSAAQDLGA